VLGVSILSLSTIFYWIVIFFVFHFIHIFEINKEKLKIPKWK